MKIAYDPIVFIAQKYGGISRYIVEVASFLSCQTNLKIFVVAPFYVNAYLKDKHGFTLLGFETKTFRWASFTPLGKIVHTFFKVFAIIVGDLILRCIRPQIIHESYYFPYALGPKKAKRVLTIHDMIHEKYPSYYPKSNKVAKFKSLAAIRADHIICNSESTKKDILELLGVNPQKITVIYLGFSNPPKLTIEPHIFNRPEKNFLLFVGMRDGYKNFRGFLEAYSQSKALRSEFVVACFGGNPFSDAEYKLMVTLGINKESVKYFGGDDERLHWFYRNASAFIYPSLYEGFGIPPLEAMSNGCPVVCSNSSSIPEVVGNAGEYFDPTIPAEIRQAIEKVVFDKNRSSDLINKGAERIKHFSWESCARKTQTVYEALFESSLTRGRRR